MHFSTYFNNHVIYRLDKEKYLAEELGIGIMAGSSFITKRCMRERIRDMCIPNALVKELTGSVTHVSLNQFFFHKIIENNTKFINFVIQIESCSKFWFQPTTEQQNVRRYSRELSENNFITQCVDYVAVTNKQIIVARDMTDQKLYRARLVSWEFDQHTKDYKSATVCFIDFGHSQKCKLNDLFVFTQENEMATKPPRCFAARLAGIQPSTANITGGHIWELASVQMFQKFVKNQNNTVKAEVYFLQYFVCLFFFNNFKLLIYRFILW